MKRIIIYTAVVLSTAGALYLLWQFRLIALLFMLSLFVAAMFRPFVEWLAGKGLPRTGAQLLTFFLAAGSLLLLFLLVGDQLAIELNDAANQTVIEYEELHRRWEVGAAWQRAVANNLPPSLSPAATESDLEQMMPMVLNLTTGLIGIVSGVLLIMALGLYWSVDQYRVERLWLSLLPTGRRAVARDSWRRIEASGGNYLRSQTVQSVLAALALGLVAWPLGFPYPVLLAVIGAVSAFIPLFGGLITAVAAFTLGSLHGAWSALPLALYTLLVFGALEFIVEPRLWPRERRSLLLTIIVILPMLDAFGIWGLVAAPLLAATSETIIEQAYKLLAARQKQGVTLETLIEHQQRLSEHLESIESSDVTPELRNLSQRLADLLAESQSTTGERQAPSTANLELEPS